MANYIDKYIQIAPSTPVYKSPEPTAMVNNNQPQIKQEAFGTNILEKFLQNKGVIATPQVKAPIANTNISTCCCGKRQSAGGYIWKYKDMFPTEAKEK